MLPMIALFRVTKQDSFRKRIKLLAGCLLAVTLMLMLVPGNIFLLPHPYRTIYVSWQVAVWIIVLLFISHCARRERWDGN